MDITEKPILIWPSLSMGEGIFIFFFVVISLFLFMIFSSFRKRSKFLSNQLNQIVHHAYSHNLNALEIKLIQRFFESLGSFEKSMNFLGDPKTFHSKLSQFFENEKTETAQTHLKILDKLFLSKNYQTEILRLEDIKIGEDCTVEIDSKILLGAVIQIKSNIELIISLESSLTLPDLSEGIIGLYRPTLGLFLLHGKITNLNSHTLEFIFQGKIDKQAELNYSSILQKKFTLYPLEKKGNLEKFIEYAGETDLISEKGLLISMTEAFALEEIRKHDIWQIDLDVNNQFMTWKGHILPIKHESGKFIFRFLHTNSDQKKFIFECLKNGKKSKNHF
jgi:hypothetical protein